MQLLIYKSIKIFIFPLRVFVLFLTKSLSIQIDMFLQLLFNQRFAKSSFGA
jgi:hypothetical protein